SSLIGGGMNWWQAILTIFLGNLIVLIPMVLNAHAGTHYGIPFPVYCRASFGTKGANIPALLRALVACGWFGIQTWIGGDAIYKILGIFVPSMLGGAPIPGLGINGVQLVCFLAFWSINMFVIFKGIASIRVLLTVQAPLGVAVTAATAVIFHRTIWDPIERITNFTNPVLLLVALVALGVATLATNIAANVVSPANDFANLMPSKITLRTGGLITGIVGIVI